MNILDFKADDLTKPIMEQTFDVVKSLFFNRYKDYQPIIKDLKVPIDIDTYEGQAVMKDYLEIRVVEELMEMREAIKEKHRNEHVFEEIADSFNFLVNAYIIYGWDHTKFKTAEDLYKEYVTKNANRSYLLVDTEIDIAILEVVYQIGIACNKLKIRPWKQSQYLTDALIFEERFEQIYYKFMDMLFVMGIRPELLWDVLSKKNKCNDFRISTGY